MLAGLGLVEPRRFRVRFDKLAREPIEGDWLDVWAVLSAEAFVRHCAGDTQAAILGHQET
jgi:hypothetical protein